MFGLGFSEIVVIGILALILLGPDQLPDLARKLGRIINDLKRTTDDLKDEFKNSGINPTHLLEDIKRERQPKAQTPSTKTSDTNSTEKKPDTFKPLESPSTQMNLEDQVIVRSAGTIDPMGAPKQADKTQVTNGSDDSGKT